MPVPSTASQANDADSFAKLFSILGLDVAATSSGEVTIECPECSKEKLCVNLPKGVYDCKTCHGAFSGNAVTLLRWYYARTLEETNDKRLRDLSTKRGIGLQTLKRWGIAYDVGEHCYFLPIFNERGVVIGGQRYFPFGDMKPNKLSLPGLRTGLFGRERMSDDPERLVILCEGIFDAMMLDYRLKQNRAKYDILALPGSYYKPLAKLLAGRKVRTVFDNDEGGDRHRAAIEKYVGDEAAELSQVVWPSGTPQGTDLSDLLRDDPDLNPIGWTQKHALRFTDGRELRFRTAAEVIAGDGYKRKKQWIWEGHIPVRSYVSLSGYQGTMKSTLCRDLAARVTSGRRMPDGSLSGVEPGPVIYVSAEDEVEDVVDSFLEHGGDVDRLHLHGLQFEDGKDATVDILRDLPKIEALVRRLRCQLVIIDGQNSLLGEADYSSDVKARSGITNRFVAFAQRNNCALIGIRNETEDGHKLGAASMQDHGRCVMRTVRPKPGDEPTGYPLTLQFEKVSGAPQPAPYRFGYVPNLGKNDRGWDRLRLSWERKRDVANMVRLLTMADAG